jgi:hypothetical protein
MPGIGAVSHACTLPVLIDKVGLSFGALERYVTQLTNVVPSTAVLTIEDE